MTFAEVDPRPATHSSGQPTAQSNRVPATFPPRLFVVALALASVLFFAGCGKKKTAETAAPEPTNVASASGPLPTYNQPVKPIAPVVQPNGEPDLAEINRTLLRWVVRNRRRPASFEDFAASAGVQIPDPPAGKKFVISKEMKVVLVKR